MNFQSVRASVDALRVKHMMGLNRLFRWPTLVPQTHPNRIIREGETRRLWRQGGGTCNAAQTPFLTFLLIGVGAIVFDGMQNFFQIRLKKVIKLDF